MGQLPDLALEDINGQTRHLSEFAGDVLLIVNVASRCVFTEQYLSLQALQEEFGAKGFHVLAFPCNQFGNQEPGDDAQIRSFCATRYDITFPLFSKIDVNGTNASPLYQWLKSQAPGLLGSEAIKWNFTKFLVDRQAKVIRRYAPQISPDSLRKEIEGLL